MRGQALFGLRREDIVVYDIAKLSWDAEERGRARAMGRGLEMSRGCGRHSSLEVPVGRWEM